MQTLRARSRPHWRAQNAARSARLQVQASSSTVPVTVSITRKVNFGEVLKLVGNQPFLGDWDAHKAAPLKWSDGHVWRATLEVPVGVDIAFKVVSVKDDGNATWEGGDNRTFKALGPDFALDVVCKWSDTSKTQVKAVPKAEAHERSPEPSLPPATQNSSAGRSRSSTSPDSSGAKSGLEQQSRSTSAWVGRDPEFVRRRLDKQERRGVWRTEGLPEVEAELVRGDEKASNWLGKLEQMKRVLVDRPARMRPDVEELSAAYVYATWINTGAIQCVETGGHHRPNHHANLALQMFRSLEWTIGDAAAGTGGSSWPAEARTLASRRMHTRLPSIHGDFRVSTPLTRIRDIAHRNDIPKDLKDEIKHTLQNKLHRSAGPEDLVATEAMLVRITAKPGEYSAPFVEEFKIFTKELRDFFNASGLLDLLEEEELRRSMEGEHQGIVNQFKAALAAVDRAGEDDVSMDDLVAAVSYGTQARGWFAKGLSAGLRNDVTDEMLAMRQRWRLAEIRIEEHIFVLLARIIGQLEKMGGAGMLASPGTSGAWKVMEQALVNGIRQLGLSSYAAPEVLALENELESWVVSYNNASASSIRETALRGKACAERILRLASQYSDVIMSVYVNPAHRLGQALGVPEHMARIFGESEVRASVAFQVSRLASLMSKALRTVAGLDAWDSLVTGEGVGRLIEVENISPETVQQAGKGHNDSMVLLVSRADGDEEIGALGGRLKGVVLCQELPHLSHLGVRARQEKVVFAMCDDSEYVKTKIRPLLGKTVQLSVRPGAVSLAEAHAAPAAPRSQESHTHVYAASSTKAATNGTTTDRPQAATIKKASKLEVLPLTQATVDTCGSKATKCGDLERLAQKEGRGVFTTPPGAVLPFGCMEQAIKSSGLTKQYQELLGQLERSDLSGSELEAQCKRMAELMASVQIPSTVLNQISSFVSGEALLAVRSSANVEDLAGMSAAGLYESKVGVPASDTEAVREAITEVWASLYTRRAVMSRQAAGVPQADATMAVLIMELVAPEVSYVLHTARPADGNTNILLAELAPGQGETLASGTRGTPWRLEVDKSNNKVHTLAFANFSKAWMVPGRTLPPGIFLRQGLSYRSFDELHGSNATAGGGGGGTAVAAAPAAPAAGPVQRPAAGLVEVMVDYSKQRLSVDAEFRKRVGQMLVEVGKIIENSYGNEPQDIEGGLLGGGNGQPPTLVVFQTRPQH